MTVKTYLYVVLWIVKHVVLYVVTGISEEQNDYIFSVEY